MLTGLETPDYGMAITAGHGHRSMVSPSQQGMASTGFDMETTLEGLRPTLVLPVGLGLGFEANFNVRTRLRIWVLHLGLGLLLSLLLALEATVVALLHPAVSRC